MKTQITTFLTFQQNNAEQAMNFYITLFSNSKIIDIRRYGKEGPGPEGSVMIARFELNGKEFICSDSFVKHNWDFTPAISNWVDCKDEDELQMLFSKLQEGGRVMMPLDNYGFSQKFGWVADQFGISWQVNLS
ncbi:VOC family protein [Pedobacter ginsengisoli]|uniref:VOC family protein n=1 Tax=Pedobacter ginsengisoli TaxID=363852 RepID=UPI00254EE0B4|nr:VOC family protein [Pedobacter ginsengisoli]